MVKWFIIALIALFSFDQAQACSCVLRSDDPADFIDRAEYIFLGDPIYMMVEDSEPDDTGYIHQTARTVFLVSKVYKGTLESSFRGDLPEYFERVERVNEGQLVSVYHGFKFQPSCDIRFEFQKQLVLAFKTNGRLATGYCSMRLLEDNPEREQEFLDILEQNED